MGVLTRVVYDIDTTPPAQVTGVSATAQSTSAIRVAWSATTDTGGSSLAGYRVTRATSSGGTYSQVGSDLSTASLALDDSGLSSSTQYFYRVYAFDGNGNQSVASATVNATTQTPATVRSALFVNTTGSSWDRGVITSLPTNFGAGEFTFEMWVKPTVRSFATLSEGSATQRTAWAANDPTPYSASNWWYHGNFLLDGHNNSSSNLAGTFSIQIYGSGRVRWLFNDGAPELTSGSTRTGGLHAVQAATTSSAASIVNGSWHKITCRRRFTGSSGSTLELFVDGILIGSTTSTVRTNMATAYWNSWTGFPSAQQGWYFAAEKQAAVGVISQWEDYVGGIAEMPFWSIARSDTDVTTNYASALNGSETGLIGYFPWSNSSGNWVDTIGAKTIVPFNLDSTARSSDGPTLSSPSGSLVHGQSFTVTGTGFGTKSPAAPLLWDNCSHGQPTSARYSATFPSSAGAGLNMDYYVPGTGSVPSVALPHANITRVLAGVQRDNGPDGGWNTGFSRGVSYVQDKPFYCYYLTRNSPSYFYDSSAENYKIWHWDEGAGPYATITDGYAEVKNFTSANSNPAYKRGTGTYNMQEPDVLGNGGTQYMGVASGATLGNKWISHEWFWGCSKTSSGFAYLIADNASTSLGGSAVKPTSGNVRLQNVAISKMAFWYHGLTIPSGGSTHYAQVGGYARYNTGTGSWRMYADVYMDDTWSRVVATDSATYDSSTIVVPQPPTAWSGTSITCTCNKGRLSSGTVHLWVFDSNNARQYIGPRTMT